MTLRIAYLLRNLSRNPLRTLLTLAAVAMPVMILVLSTAVISGINRFLDNSVKQLRLVVTQKASIANPLPLGHRLKIESLDPERKDLVAVCGMRYLGGTVEGVQQPLSTLAVEHDTFPLVYPEQLATPEEREAWFRDRQALVAGRSTAAQMGWRVGDKVTIRASVPPYTPMEFRVISTAPQAADDITLFCRLDYVQEEIRRADMLPDIVSLFFVKCGSDAALDRLRVAIDQLFAGSVDETLTQHEKAFMSEFIRQQFDLPTNLSILSAVTIFVAVMAAMNTMGMNFRDRLSEFATLKSLGFRSRWVFALMQTESVLLCALGGLIGAGAPYIAFTYTPLRNYKLPVIQALEIAPQVCLYGILISVAIGVVAAAPPALAAARTRVVDAFRVLE